MAVLNYKLVLICATLMAAAAAAVITVDASGDHHLQHPILGWIPTRSPCKGSIAECLAGEEFELDSESSRRILATTRYISYGALQRNTVPCSRRGASYYNCKPGAQANPYNRGCSRITRCRGWTLFLLNIYIFYDCGLLYMKKERILVGSESGNFTSIFASLCKRLLLLSIYTFFFLLTKSLVFTFTFGVMGNFKNLFNG